ncbi:MAG: hypothetical protein FWF75_05970 [Propionibacteriaceae bacterium]|nr:hypothetical protein [Propionibacteriaceae bacterium]
MSLVNLRPPRMEAGSDADNAWQTFSELIAGVLLYGSLGWVGDHFLHTSFLLPTGVLFGLGLVLFLVYKRYVGGQRRSDAE